MDEISRNGLKDVEKPDILLQEGLANFKVWWLRPTQQNPTGSQGLWYIRHVYVIVYYIYNIEYWFINAPGVSYAPGYLRYEISLWADLRKLDLGCGRTFRCSFPLGFGRGGIGNRVAFFAESLSWWDNRAKNSFVGWHRGQNRQLRHKYGFFWGTCQEYILCKCIVMMELSNEKCIEVLCHK